MGDFARLFDHFIGSEIGGSYIGHGYTNERGYVSMNYIAILRLEALSGEIRDTGKNVDYYTTPRINIDYAGEHWAGKMWRFVRKM